MNFSRISKIRSIFIVFLAFAAAYQIAAQDKPSKNDGDLAKANAIVAKAVELLGGSKYLGVRSQIGKGKFSMIRDGAVVSFQSFVDVFVFPDKERTEFKSSGIYSIQTNSKDGGWIFDGEQEIIRAQTEQQIAGFKQSIRASLDNLLRGHWKGHAELSYIGQRPATLGKRNDVVKLEYDDGFAVEYEFSDDGLPAKAIYKTGGEGDDAATEEDHYAQFVEVSGIMTPFIIDRFSNGKRSSRINYESVEFNKSIPDWIFDQPANAKEAKKGSKI